MSLAPVDHRYLQDVRCLYFAFILPFIYHPDAQKSSAELTVQFEIHSEWGFQILVKTMLVKNFACH